jgi:hypothetical protein
MTLRAQTSSRTGRPTSSRFLGGTLRAAAWLLPLGLLGLLSLPTGCTDPQKLPAQMAGVYVEVFPLNGGLQQIYTLDLRTNFSVAFSREYIKRGKTTDFGTWTNQGRTILVTVKPKGKSKSTNPPPEVFEFQWTGKKVISTKWDKTLYGEEGLGTFLRTTNRSEAAPAPPKKAP